MYETESKYWKLAVISFDSPYRFRELAAARDFFKQRFSGYSKNLDPFIQRSFLEIMRYDGQDSDIQRRCLAEVCLRCFISQEIVQVCQDLYVRFGDSCGFDIRDLISIVLDDTGEPVISKSREDYFYNSRATKILTSYDLDKSSLRTWTYRLIKNDGELGSFLFSYGISLVSDWAILNNFSSQRLKRLLTEVYGYSPIIANNAAYILDAYHEVYLGDRLKQSSSRFGTRCLTPTHKQLDRMVEILIEKNISNYRSNDILEQLNLFSELIRRVRQPVYQSHMKDVCIAVNQTDEIDEEIDEEIEDFLQTYRQLCLSHLDRAIEQELNRRVKVLKSRTKDQIFLEALRLHCQGETMSGIAKQIGLKQQYQVSRLLQLKSIRHSVKRNLVQSLTQDILALSYRYASYDKSYLTSGQIEAAVADQIDEIFSNAERAAWTSPSRSGNLGDNLFVQRLSLVLEHIIDTSS